MPNKIKGGQLKLGHNSQFRKKKPKGFGKATSIVEDQGTGLSKSYVDAATQRMTLGELAALSGIGGKVL